MTDDAMDEGSKADSRREGHHQPGRFSVQGIGDRLALKAGNAPGGANLPVVVARPPGTYARESRETPNPFGPHVSLVGSRPPGGLMRSSGVFSGGVSRKLEPVRKQILRGRSGQ